MLRSSGNTPRYQNAVVRGSATLVLFNTGETSAGLDLYIYPKQPMSAGSIEISQGMGSHKCKFTSLVNAGDEFASKLWQGMSTKWQSHIQGWILSIYRRL